MKRLLPLLLVALILAPQAVSHVGSDPGYRTYGKVRKPNGETRFLPIGKARRLFEEWEHRIVHRGKGRVSLSVRRERTPVWFSGEASFYGEAFRGNTTACGTVFNPDELTAAHRTIECGTRIVVRNPANRKEVLVTITDRGPFIEGRVLDLSEAAFSRIAPLGQGVVYVEARRP